MDHVLCSHDSRSPSMLFHRAQFISTINQHIPVNAHIPQPRWPLPAPPPNPPHLAESEPPRQEQLELASLQPLNRQGSTRAADGAGYHGVHSRSAVSIHGSKRQSSHSLISHPGCRRHYSRQPPHSAIRNTNAQYAQQNAAQATWHCTLRHRQAATIARRDTARQRKICELQKTWQPITRRLYTTRMQSRFTCAFSSGTVNWANFGPCG